MKKYIIIFIILSAISYSAEIIGKVEKTRENDEGNKRDIEIEYNEKGQILQEVHRNIVGDITAKYIFNSYDEKSGKPFKGLIYDGNGEKKAEVEMHYNKNNEIVLMIQKDENGDIISLSQFFKDKDGIFEEVTNDKAELYKLLKHYDKKSVNLLSEAGKKEYEKFQMQDEKDKNEKNSNIVAAIEKDSIKSIETLKSKEELIEVGDAVTITRINLLNDDVMKKDTLLAEIFTDGIKTRSRADGVIINGAAFVSSLKSGKIYREDLKKVIQDEKFYYVYLTGKEIVAILENGKAFEYNSEWYPNMAGITVESDGNKVKNIRINGFPIDIYAKYRIAVNGYIISGNGIYSGIENKDKEEIKESAVDMVEKYMRMIKIIDKSYILEIRNRTSE